MIRMKLLKYDDVVDIIERVTNEAIEKKKNKATIQKMLICEIDALESAETDQAETDQNDYSSWLRISTIVGDRYVCDKCS